MLEQLLIFCIYPFVLNSTEEVGQTDLPCQNAK